MRKTLTAVAAAATIGVVTVAAPTTADARWGWWGPALGAFAVGAIVGGALARPYYYGGDFGGDFSAVSFISHRLIHDYSPAPTSLFYLPVPLCDHHHPPPPRHPP